MKENKNLNHDSGNNVELKKKPPNIAITVLLVLVVAAQIGMSLAFGLPWWVIVPFTGVVLIISVLALRLGVKLGEQVRDWDSKK